MCKAEARELGCSLQRAFGGSQGSAAVSPAVSLYVGMRDSTAAPCPLLVGWVLGSSRGAQWGSAAQACSSWSGCVSQLQGTDLMALVLTHAVQQAWAAAMTSAIPVSKRLQLPERLCESVVSLPQCLGGLG